MLVNIIVGLDGILIRKVLMQTYTYTDADFFNFINYIKEWLKKFGLTEYQVDYAHIKLDTAARCTYDVRAKLACFQLAKESEYDFCVQDDLNKLALHEVLHLLLAELGFNIHATKDYFHDTVVAAEHTVVNRLINAILED